MNDTDTKALLADAERTAKVLEGDYAMPRVAKLLRDLAALRKNAAESPMTTTDAQIATGARIEPDVSSPSRTTKDAAHAKALQDFEDTYCRGHDDCHLPHAAIDRAIQLLAAAPVLAAHKTTLVIGVDSAPGNDTEVSAYKCVSCGCVNVIGDVTVVREAAPQEGMQAVPDWMRDHRNCGGASPVVVPPPQDEGNSKDLGREPGRA